MSLSSAPFPPGPDDVVAEIDRGAIAEARYDLDVTGHYARPDVFALHVDERAKRPVRSTPPDGPRPGDPQDPPLSPPQQP